MTLEPGSELLTKVVALGTRNKGRDEHMNFSMLVGIRFFSRFNASSVFNYSLW